MSSRARKAFLRQCDRRIRFEVLQGSRYACLFVSGFITSVLFKGVYCCFFSRIFHEATRIIIYAISAHNHMEACGHLAGRVLQVYDSLFCDGSRQKMRT